MSQQRRPNILFIMADDHASKAISAYGANINHTPNLDRLAKEGILLNHCYVTNSICTPSRAAILTGTYNHVNGVVTLDSKINKNLPNVAKHLRTAGYDTAMVGKWHLGEGESCEPSGFDYWSVLPGQGDYWDPTFIDVDGHERVTEGYATDIITEKSLAWLEQRPRKDKPWFLMCHHKAPHRSWECDEKHKDLYKHPIKVPDTFSDDYKNRAKAAKIAKMRVADDLTYKDLGLVQPDGGRRALGEKMWSGARKIPNDPQGLRLIDADTGVVFTFSSAQDLGEFKFQRYMQRYLRTIQSIDDNVGRMLTWLEQTGQAEDTVVIYTSDQGFFLGEHGWFDKRFMYEESFQMPFLCRYPREIRPGSVNDDLVNNVDFAPLFLDYAAARRPSYMQGRSFRRLLQGHHGVVAEQQQEEEEEEPWKQIAYHRYWMHNDEIHEAYAHYGCRDQRFKLIYWYCEALGVEGARPGGEEYKEWELFDCQQDPLELFNLYNDPAYQDVVARMTRLLEDKMEEIGDEPVHVTTKSRDEEQRLSPAVMVEAQPRL